MIEVHQHTNGRPMCRRRHEWSSSRHLGL